MRVMSRSPFSAVEGSCCLSTPTSFTPDVSAAIEAFRAYSRSMATHASAEPDLAAGAAAFADPRRVRVLVALSDGRALPAGRLAQEAGVSASTVSNHLRVLLDHGLVTVEQQGRHRFYRLASPHVEGVLEALALVSPPTPITSLRQHTRSHALRAGRTCYRHLAGQLGVQLFAHLIANGWVVGGDGHHHPGRTADRFSAPGTSERYRLTDPGAAALAAWGIDPALLGTTSPLRYDVDWTEQAHHLAGPLGTAITRRLFERGVIERGRIPRSVVLIDNDWLADLTRCGALSYAARLSRRYRPGGSARWRANARLKANSEV
jgi:DNA-binding transcriptional ArsR family regulator